jgi:hypothetical protein
LTVSFAVGTYCVIQVLDSNEEYTASEKMCMCFRTGRCCTYITKFTAKTKTENVDKKLNVENDKFSYLQLLQE